MYLKSYAIAAYTYKAETLCPFCTILALSPTVEGDTVLSRGAEDALDHLAEQAGIDRQDEHSFDSDDFPKVVFVDSVVDGESCDACGEDLL